MQTDTTFHLTPLGDSAVVIELGKTIDLQIHRRVKALAKYLNTHAFPGMVEYIPAFTTLTVVYDPVRIQRVAGKSPYESVCSIVKQIMTEIKNPEKDSARIVEIPLCYGGEFGPDLEYVAEHNGLSVEEVIKIHSHGEYLVYMVGFAPGFPYMEREYLIWDAEQEI